MSNFASIIAFLKIVSIFLGAIFFLPHVSFSTTFQEGDVVTCVNGDGVFVLGPYSQDLYCAYNSTVTSSTVPYVDCASVPDPSIVIYVASGDTCTGELFADCVPYNPSSTACTDAGKDPEVDCGSTENVVWDDADTCKYHCLSCDDQMAQAITVCGDIGKIIWDNVDICQYHCDQGECEEAYLLAKQQCSNPTLVDSLNCTYSCNCQTEKDEAQSACPLGYNIDFDTCFYSCKCCQEKTADCLAICGFSENIKNFSCSDSIVDSDCVIDSQSFEPCECIVPPVDGAGGPIEDPDGGFNPDKLSCSDLKQQINCDPSCQWICSPDDNGVALFANCDCGADPVDPNDPDNPDGPDDGANGWLKKIEENTDRTSNLLADMSPWVESIKKNTDTLITNDKKYFQDRTNRSVFKDISGDSVFKDRNGESYLKTIAEKEFPNNIKTTGIGIVPGDNTYDSTLDEVPEETFSQGLSSYIATGIPLVSYLNDTTFSLSSASPVLQFEFYGSPIVVDFSDYVSIIDIMGNLLLSITVFSGFILIIKRN